MPELPEVETIRRQLVPLVEGHTLSAVEVADPRWVSPSSAAAFERALTGRSVRELARRGKYLIAHLDDQAALVMHLRMTGNLRWYAPEEEPAERHLRGRLWLEDSGHRESGSVAFLDARRFGTAELLADEQALASYLGKRLGPEPFSDEFDAEHLHASTRHRRTPIKALLLDQSVVAGIGNIYADESLFRAGISPRRRAERLTRTQSARLTETVREALQAGLDAHGASISDCRDIYGRIGSFQNEFLVHRREGLPCPLCERPVKKIRCAGRGTYYCPNCQK